MKMLTINEMILNTLTTKMDKTPKYKLILEQLGYTLNNTHDWSTYNYWGINIPNGKGILVISKDYSNKKRIYITCTSVAPFDKASKVNFENLLKVKGDREKNKDFEYNIKFNKTNIQKIIGFKKEIEYYNRGKERTKKRIKDLMTEIENYDKLITEIRNKIDDIKNDMKK